MATDTVIEFFDDQLAYTAGVPTTIEVLEQAETKIIEVILPGAQGPSIDPATGMPFAVMAIQGRKIYVSTTAPTSGMVRGDLWVPIPPP